MTMAKSRLGSARVMNDRPTVSSSPLIAPIGASTRSIVSTPNAAPNTDARARPGRIATASCQRASGWSSR